jgi:hypothetical protein
MNIKQDSRQSITDKLIDAVYLDAQKILSDNDMLKLYDSGSVVKIVNTIYDYILIDSVYDNNNLVDIYDKSDSVEYLKESLATGLTLFYKTNPKLLSEDFTLNNNFYFTDLRCFIVDLEDSLLQERQGK